MEKKYIYRNALCIALIVVAAILATIMVLRIFGMITDDFMFQEPQMEQISGVDFSEFFGS